MLIRHCAVDLCRVNVDRAPKDLGVEELTSERIGEVGERELVWTVSGAARNET